MSENTPGSGRRPGSDPDDLYRRQKAEVEHRMEATRWVDWFWAALAGVAAAAAVAYLLLNWPGGAVPGAPPIVVQREAHPVLAALLGAAAFAFTSRTAHRALRAHRARSYWGL